MPFERVSAPDIQVGARVIDDRLRVTASVSAVTEEGYPDDPRGPEFIVVTFDGAPGSVRLPAEALVWVVTADDRPPRLGPQHAPSHWDIVDAVDAAAEAPATDAPDATTPADRDAAIRARSEAVIRGWDPNDADRRARAAELAWILVAVGDTGGAAPVIALAQDAFTRHGEPGEGDDLSVLEPLLVGRVRGRRSRPFRRAREGSAVGAAERSGDLAEVWQSHVAAMAAAITRASDADVPSDELAAFLDAYRHAAWAWVGGVEGAGYDPDLIAADLKELGRAVAESVAAAGTEPDEPVASA